MSSKQLEIAEGTVINGKWRCNKTLGSGSQGVVYSAVDIESGNLVAIKTGQARHLKKEFDTYLAIKQQKRYSSLSGIPDVHYYYYSGGSAIMVMDLLGPSLSHLFAYQGNVFSSKTLFMLFKHMLIALQNLHESGFVHRDIKPGNICMGRGEHAGVVHFIDLGVTIPWKDEITGNHVPMEQSVAFNGTVKFASLNVLSGRTCSRRDDVESLIYVMMFLCKNGLPFGEIDKHSLKKAIYDSRMQKAMDTKKICEGYPSLLKDLLYYVRSLEYDERPDYVMMRDLVESYFARFGFHEDGYFDWFYTKTGEEVESSPKNLDRLYEQIFSLFRTESTSSDKKTPIDPETAKSEQIGTRSNNGRGETGKTRSDQSAPVKQNDERSSTSNAERKLTSSRSGFFKRIPSIRKKNSAAVDISKTEDRNLQSGNKSANHGHDENQEESTRKEGVFRRILKRRDVASNKKSLFH